MRPSLGFLRRDWTFLTCWVPASAACLFSFYSISSLWGLLLIFCRFDTVREQASLTRARDVEIFERPFSYVASFRGEILKNFWRWRFFPPMIFDLVRPISKIRSLVQVRRPQLIMDMLTLDICSISSSVGMSWPLHGGVQGQIPSPTVATASVLLKERHIHLLAAQFGISRGA
jgi:hypothetical protein